MEAATGRLIFCGVTFALSVLFWTSAATAESNDNRKPATTAGAASSGSAGDLFEGVGNLFSGDDDEREIGRLDGTESYAGIAANRSLSLRLMHGIGSGIVTYPGFADYANKVLAKLIAAAPVKNLPARVFVIGSGNLNAGAMPCGAIAVYWGLLHALRTEDELAFVLSHELGHIIFHHHDTDFFVDSQHYAVTTAAITDELADKAGASYGFRFDSDDQLGRAIRIGRIAEKVSENLLLPSFTRDQEDAADRFGVDLMIRAGYNPVAVMSFFTTLEAWESGQSSDGKLDAAITQYLEDKSKNVMTETISAKSLIEDVLSFAETVADNASAPDHYPASQRKKQVQKYMAAHYPKPVTVVPIVTPWAGGANTEIAKAQNQFASADQAFRRLDAGKLAEAEKLATASVAGQMTSESFSRFALYMVRFAQGQKDKAEASLDSALKAPQPGVLIWQARIRIAENEGRLKEAAALLDEARRRLDDPPALLPDRIRIYPKVGRQNEATALLVECQLQWRSMAEKCAAENNRLRL
jgi:predicted Zn-dependent protease